MKSKTLFLLVLLSTCPLLSCKDAGPSDPETASKLIGCWKGGLVRDNVIVERDMELRRISFRPDSTIELSAIFELGPRSRVWRYSFPITCRNDRISWLAHQGSLSEDGDTMRVVKNWKGETSDWLFIRDRGSDDFTTQLMSSESREYSYEIPDESSAGWQSIDLEAAGMDGGKITELVDRIRQGKHGDIHSLLICRFGKLTLEEYFASNGELSGPAVQQALRDKPHHLASVTKGILSALVGIAVDRELILDVDEPIEKYLPEYEDSFNPKSDRIRIQDLLTMRAGWKWEQFKYGWNDKRNNAAEMFRSEDAIRYVLELPMADRPGQVFNYSNGESTVLGRVLRNACGMPVEEFADRVLFEPLGISDYVWTRYPDGSLETDGGLALRSRDLAKIGQLFLQNGTWDGRSLISPHWVRESTIRRVGLSSNRGFGYYWNEMKLNFDGVRETAIFAPGDGGQFLAILPALEMVIVMTAGNYDRDPTAACWALIRDEIVPAMTDLGKGL